MELLQTHQRREDPLPQSRADLLEANSFLLSIHVEVKLFCSAGQEPLQNHRLTAEEALEGKAAAQQM